MLSRFNLNILGFLVAAACALLAFNPTSAQERSSIACTQAISTKELKDKKFYEIRHKLGSQALHLFLKERMQELGIRDIPEGDAIARARAFQKLEESELPQGERKPWTVSGSDTRTQNLQKMHAVPLAPEGATWEQRIAVMRAKLDIAQFGREVTAADRDLIPEKDRPFTQEELELALRSGIAGDEDIRTLERAAKTGGPEDLFRYWVALRRRGKLPETIFTPLAPNPSGKPKTPEEVQVQAQALEIYRASLAMGDKRFLPDEFLHRMRDYALANVPDFNLDRVLEQTPRFGQFIPLIRPGDRVEFMMGASASERERFGIAPNAQRQHRVVLTQPVELAADLFTVGELRMLGIPLPDGYRQNNIQPRDNEPLRFVSRDFILNTILPKLDEVMKGTGKKYILPTEAQLELAMRLDNDRKPTTTIYPWGDDWSSAHSPADPANNWANAPLVDGHAPTGLLFANLNGMLWQWTSDTYALDYGGTPEVSNDPQGPPPQPGSIGVVRGGGFGNTPVICRSAHRSGYVPAIGWNGGGFRLARIDEK